MKGWPRSPRASLVVTLLAEALMRLVVIVIHVLRFFATLDDRRAERRRRRAERRAAEGMRRLIDLARPEAHAPAPLARR